MFASKFLVLLTVFVFSAYVIGPNALASSPDDSAANAINVAENSLLSAYQAVLDAEQVGADVSGFLNELNVGAKHLAQAHISYRIGNYEDAVHSANLCNEIGMRVKVEAYEAMKSGQDQKSLCVWLTIVGSTVAAMIIACASFFAWSVFKRRYYRRILKMRPKGGFDVES